MTNLIKKVIDKQFRNNDETDLDFTNKLNGIVRRIFKHTKHKYIKIEFSKKYEDKIVVASTINSGKNWNKFIIDSKKMIEQKIEDEKIIKLIN